MITRIQYTGQAETAGTRLVNKQKSASGKMAGAQTVQGKLDGETGKADFSKLLFDAFREQNRTFFGGAANQSAAAGAGGVNASSLWGKQGVSVSDTELDRIFEEASKKYNVPLALLKAVAKAESNFNPNDVSSAGAIGIMQLMPETAKGLGVDNPFDPEQNIMGGAKYLADKLKMYNGDVELALAAYNAGSGNVEKYGGVPPFAETKNYIKKVLSYMES